jgi:hypothetical protein
MTSDAPAKYLLRWADPDGAIPTRMSTRTYRVASSERISSERTGGLNVVKSVSGY